MEALKQDINGSGRSDGRPQRVGLLAGAGRLPILVAEALGREGIATYCLGVVGQADARLAEVCDDFHPLGIARFGTAIRYFKRHGVTEATMAGKVNKRFVFHPWVAVRHLPDLKTIRYFASHFWTRRDDNKDDTLLGRVIELFAADGIRLGPATDYAPELLVNKGQLTRRGPSTAQLKDIQFGWHLAKEMGRLDVGQSVLVKNQAVLAVEAVEGTDLCIRRAGELCPTGGFTLVKVAKPRQDMRFDVPTIGMDTLQTMVETGGRVLAIEADRTIVLDQPEAVAFADRHKLVIVALEHLAAERPRDRSSAA